MTQYTVQLLELNPDGSHTAAAASHDAGITSAGTFDTFAPLEENTVYLVQVTATNAFGLSTTGLSGPLRLDNDAPTCSWIIDGTGNMPGDDITVHSSDSFLSTCWLCSDVAGGSGIQSASVRLLDNSGSLVYAEAATGSDGTVQCSSALGISLPSGDDVYTFEVTVTDGSGQTGVATSDGFSVDNTPAVQTVVNHGSSGSAPPVYASTGASFAANFMPWAEDTGALVVTE